MFAFTRCMALLVACIGYGLAPEAARAEFAGNQPPVAVPPGARADVTAMTFPVAPMTFATEASVADVAVKQVGREQRFTLAADVLFDFDRAELRPEADKALRKFLVQLGPRAAHMRIEGHTDGKGSDTYNDGLAMHRAASVKAWIVTMTGIAPNTLVVSGFGKRRPVASNTKPDGSDDPDGRQRNRRVEIIVQ